MKPNNENIYMHYWATRKKIKIKIINPKGQWIRPFSCRTYGIRLDPPREIETKTTPYLLDGHIESKEHMMCALHLMI